MSKNHFPDKPVLLVDDEAAALVTNEIALTTAGVNNIASTIKSQEVMVMLEQQPCSVAVIDLNMPGLNGEQLLEKLNENYPEMPVIILTGENDVETAVRCMKKGAFDYLVKPVEEDRLANVVKRALEFLDLRETTSSFHDLVFSGTLNNPDAFSEIITASPKMFTVFQYIESVAPSSQPILITGETGVGKELLARAVHEISGRSGNFVPENLAGLDDAMFADTLFGHVKGAYTGADSNRKGLIDRAAGGTLLLDEIGDIKPASQIKLLRLLQEREYYPLGSDSAHAADVRIVAATNRTTSELQKDADFRNDLYFRLKTHHVHLPGLRERKEDLPLLLEHFLKEAAKDLNKAIPTTPPELITLLKTHNFPGNIRELRAMVFDAVGKHTSKVLSMDSFRQSISYDETQELSVQEKDANPFSELETLPSIKSATSDLIEEAIRRADGNQSIAAGMLGITPSSLSKRLKRSS